MPDSANIRMKRMPGWITGIFVAGTFLALTWFESKRPLRKSVEPKLVREARNLSIAGLGVVALTLCEDPVTRPLTRWSARRRRGILPALRLPVWLEIVAAVMLLDYTLYLWHVLTHKVPWLWRFHAAHHVDLDLDASTAIRFHVGELTQSVAWRAAQIVVIGVSPLALSVWQTLLLVSILFHHSNANLATESERRLGWFVVTPRMHGIHHSMRQNETNSNWSSGLSLWDRIHRTLKLDVPQDAVTIGVPALQNPSCVTLPRVLSLPFDPPADWWTIRN